MEWSVRQYKRFGMVACMSLFVGGCLLVIGLEGCRLDRLKSGSVWMKRSTGEVFWSPAKQKESWKGPERTRLQKMAKFPLVAWLEVRWDGIWLDTNFAYEQVRRTMRQAHIAWKKGLAERRKRRARRSVTKKRHERELDEPEPTVISDAELARLIRPKRMRVMPLKNGRVLARFKKDKKAGSFLILPLFESFKNFRMGMKRLVQETDSIRFRGRMGYLIAPEIPYRTLVEILYTSGQSEHERFWFGLRGKSSVSDGALPLFGFLVTPMTCCTYVKKKLLATRRLESEGEKQKQRLRIWKALSRKKGLGLLKDLSIHAKSPPTTRSISRKNVRKELAKKPTTVRVKPPIQTNKFPSLARLLASAGREKPRLKSGANPWGLPGELGVSGLSLLGVERGVVMSLGTEVVPPQCDWRLFRAWQKRTQQERWKHPTFLWKELHQSHRPLHRCLQEIQRAYSGSKRIQMSLLENLSYRRLVRLFEATISAKGQGLWRVFLQAGRM